MKSAEAVAGDGDVPDDRESEECLDVRVMRMGLDGSQEKVRKSTWGELPESRSFHAGVSSR